MIRIVSLVLFALLLQPAQAKTFKIATAAPDGTMWMEELRDAAQTIDQKTAGRVKFRFYPGGVMGSDKSVLRKIRIGQLHGGLITGGGLATVYPDANLYNLPFIFRSYEEVDYVRGKLDPLIIEGLEKNGYVSFGFSEGGFAYMLANKPVAGISDLEGLKVWIPEGDRISKAAFEAARISPLPLPLADVLTGLQTGLIDTVAASPVGTIALQWHTQVSYMTNAPLMYLYGGIMMKKSAFDRLSKEDQAIVNREMGAAFKRINDQNRIDDRKAREVLQQVGIQFVEPPAAEKESWLKLADAATRALLDNGYLTQRNYQYMLDLLEEYRKSR